MPELPEVENVRRTLVDKIVNRTIKTVKVSDNRVIKFNRTDDFTQRLVGLKINALSRRGKFLILNLSNDEVLVVHLGMTGAFLHNNGDYTIYPDNIKNHILIECDLDDDTKLIYSDYRRFGSLRVVTEQDLKDGSFSHLKTLVEMGPEPFEEGAFDKFLTNIRHRRYMVKPIKDVLLDQRVIAGAGNIYANECLFPVRVNPFTIVDDLSDKQLKMIFNVLVGLLRLSIEMGGTSIRDYVDGDGKSGSFQDVLKVYDRGTCQTCGNDILKDFINNRATFYCPDCQPFA